jgi:hypothetical protein
MRAHLAQEFEAFDDTIVQVDELCLGQLVDVNVHDWAPHSSERLGLPTAEGRRVSPVNNRSPPGLEFFGNGVEAASS